MSMSVRRIAQSENNWQACIISALARKAPCPKCSTILTASSNLAYWHENSSLDIPSLTDCPRGDERSRISLTVPSGLGAALIGERWVCRKRGKGKGPDVWPGRVARGQPFGYSIIDPV